MRALWSLPKAAPVLLRHMAAYAELAALDLARTQRDITAQIIASAILGVCLFFGIAMACLGVIAYTWDTPYRIPVIAWMSGGFLVVAIGAALYRANLARGSLPFMSTVRREWQEDKVILERILAPEEERG